MTRLVAFAAALMLGLSASPAWSQSAEAIAAREVTAAERAYLNEHFAAQVETEVDGALVMLAEMPQRLHGLFPETLHAEVDATIMEYFESQRANLRAEVMQAMAEIMTLDEMRGMGLNTRRSLEIQSALSARMRGYGQQMALGALRDLCARVQDRVPDTCATILQRVGEIEAESAA